MTEQIRAFQDLNFASLLAGATPMVSLGSYSVRTKPAGYFRCWADADRNVDKSPYVTINHQCSTDDSIYLGEGLYTGKVRINYNLTTTEELGRNRFYTLYESSFSFYDIANGTETSVTNFECRTRNVQRQDKGGGTITMRAAICLRAYKKLTGLYDASVRMATLGSMNSGLASSLSLTGVTYENAQAIIQRFLERVP
jgi:hypothetical protein